MKYHGIEIGEITPFDLLFLDVVKIEWLELELECLRAEERSRARGASPAVWPRIKDDRTDL